MITALYREAGTYMRIYYRILGIGLLILFLSASMVLDSVSARNSWNDHTISRTIPDNASIPAPPNYVHRPLVEFFTGLSCPSCMNGPHPQMDGIWEENCDDPEQPFSYVVFHELNGGGVDDLATEESRERMRHYQPGISGTPDAEFDGGYIELGGLTGGSLDGSSALSAIEDCKVRYQRNINPIHPLQSLRSNFKYVELFVDQVFTGTGFAVSVRVKYLGSNAVLPLDPLHGYLYVFMVEEKVEAHSTIEEATVVNRNVFRGYAIKEMEFTLSREEVFTTAVEWTIPEEKVPVRPGNVSAVAAVFDMDDTASEEGNKGNSAQVPRCIQSATPASSAFDRENDLPVIERITADYDGRVNIEASIEDSDGISAAYVLYNFEGANSTAWSSAEMNLSGSEICDDSGVCYAYGGGGASAAIAAKGENTLYYMILAYDGSGIEYGGLGGETRSDIHSYTPVGAGGGSDGGRKIDIGVVGWILGVALLIFLLSLFIVVSRKSGGDGGKASLMRRLRSNKKLFYSIIAVFLLVAVILGVYLTSLLGSDDAPDFTVTDVDGGEFTLSDHRGKVILIDFMATWCPGCVDVMPELVEVYGEHGDEIIMITVDVDRTEDRSDLRSFRDEHGARWRFAMDTDELQRKYNVKTIPKLVIIDAKGNVVYTHSGSESAGKISQEIERAQAEEAAGVSLGEASLGLVGFAVVVGVGSFFSPCAFPLLPGYMSYYLGMERAKSMKRALLGGGAAAAGLLMVYIVVGIIVGVGGSAVTPVIGLLEPIIGAIIIVLGLIMLLDYTLPVTGLTESVKNIYRRIMGRERPVHSQATLAEGGYSKLFWYGAGYAGAAAGCTAPLLLAITLTALASGGFFSAFIVFMIAAGVMAILMMFITLLIAASAGTILDGLRVSTAWIKRVSGVVLILVGAYLVAYYLMAFL